MNFLRSEVCRHGKMVWPVSDTTIGKALELYGEFAEGENRVMARYIRPGNLVVDVGANLGTTVLPASKAVGKDGTVFAFEPQPIIAQCLNTTLSLNDCFNVRVFSNALGNEQGWGRIPSAGIENSGNHGSNALGSQGLQVPILKLDDIELPSCELIKLDVEGYEWPVLQGAFQQILLHRPVIYLEAKKIKSTNLCIQWLLANGWRCYWHFAFFYRRDNFRKNMQNIFGAVGDMNVLAIPNSKQQPDDMPEIINPNEDWQSVYGPFYQKREMPIP
ncbi:MAG: FkbM family methyltransferase [Spartobacteria bacterium]